jgi:hypothetical protein
MYQQYKHFPIRPSLIEKPMQPFHSEQEEKNDESTRSSEQTRPACTPVKHKQEIPVNAKPKSSGLDIHRRNQLQLQLIEEVNNKNS